MWDEITYPFPNLNGTTVEVLEWVSNFVPHFIGHVSKREEIATYLSLLHHMLSPSTSMNSLGLDMLSCLIMESWTFIAVSATLTYSHFILLS